MFRVKLTERTKEQLERIRVERILRNLRTVIEAEIVGARSAAPELAQWLRKKADELEGKETTSCTG